MKTIHLAVVCFALFMVSCNSDSKPAVTDNPAGVGAVSSLAQKNLEAVHVVTKAFETGDVSGIDSVVASDFVDHTDKGEGNRDSLKAMIKAAYATNKNMKMEIVKEVADDNYAFSLMRYSGTGDGVSMPAGPYDMHMIEVVKFSNGKAVEHWAYMEMGEVTKMMQKMPVMDKIMPAAGKKK
ncbi:MAG: nuclear transport factor 2 family protein [Bacteroidota bacterium]